MLNKGRLLLLVTTLAAFLGGAGASGQVQQLPPAPVPVLPPSSPSAQPSTSPQSPADASVDAPPLFPPGPLHPPVAPYPDHNGPLLRRDPLLDQPPCPDPGWFAALELNVVGPQIKNRLQAPVAINSPLIMMRGIRQFLPDSVHLPTAELDWTGAPRFEIGYRLPDGCGEFLLSYRFLITEGSATLPEFDFGDGGFLKSRLDMHVIDLDYGSREFSLDPHWDMKWRLGARLANVFFDSLAEGFLREERTSNHFIGAGPHVGLDLWRSLPIDGLGLFVRLEGASVIGQISQGFERVIGDEVLLGGATLVHHTQAVPVLNLQAGLSWVPWNGRSRFALGYEFERWWYLGEAAASRAELTNQGFFVRGEFGF